MFRMLRTFYVFHNLLLFAQGKVQHFCFSLYSSRLLPSSDSILFSLKVLWFPLIRIRSGCAFHGFGFLLRLF